MDPEEREWQRRLTPEQFRVLRQKGTEHPGTGCWLNEHRSGTFFCAGCGAPLFKSTEKFESGSGWPSFTAPVSDQAVREELDLSHGMRRLEVTCAACGGHLGHVFPDGPKPSGQRFCINSVALQFQPES
jgi:peptide-methionine (R)-S-oxide reductase